MEKKILVSTWARSSKYIVKYARSKNYIVNIISESHNLFSINNGEKDILFKVIDCGLNSSLGLKIADNKELTYKLSNIHNISIPKSYYFQGNKNHIDDFISSIDAGAYPLITKPTDASKSQGVFLGINTPKQFKQGLLYSMQYSNNIVIQDEIIGFVFRILVVGDKVVGVLKRSAPYITGNGNDNIGDLIKQENIKREKKKHNYFLPIILDEVSISYIADQGMNKDSIPKKGVEIYLRKDHEPATGGFTIDYTDEIHPKIAEECCKISRISGLAVCGIDYMCKDISISPLQEKGAILEMNATPAIGSHENPSVGKSRNVAEKIVELAFNTIN